MEERRIRFCGLRNERSRFTKWMTLGYCCDLGNEKSRSTRWITLGCSCGLGNERSRSTRWMTIGLLLWSRERKIPIHQVSNDLLVLRLASHSLGNERSRSMTGRPYCTFPLSVAVSGTKDPNPQMTNYLDFLSALVVGTVLQKTFRFNKWYRKYCTIPVGMMLLLWR